MLRLSSFRTVPLLAAAMLVTVGCARIHHTHHDSDVTHSDSGPGIFSRQYQPKAGSDMNVTQMAFPTGDVSTSRLLVHQVVPKEVRASSPYASEIHVTNLTEGTLQSVTVTGKGFENFKLSQSSPAAVAGENGALWDLGDIGPGATEVIKITGTAGALGTSAWCVTATYTNYLCAATKVVAPALTVTKSGPAETAICDPFAYKIVVKNTGTAPATNVRVRDTLPQGLATTDGKSSVDLAAGNLAGGESKEFTVNVKAAKPGSYSNGASAVADGGLTAESAAVKTVVRQQTLAIEAECPGALMALRNGTIIFTVKNTGDAACPTTQVVAPIPAHCEFVSADNGGKAEGGKVTWNLGTLNAQGNKAVSFVVRAASAGTASVTATATGGCATPAKDDCEFDIKATPDIGTTTSDAGGVVTVGDPHDFRIEVRNQGQMDLTNVVCVVDVDAGLEFVSTNVAGAATKDGQKVTLKLGTLKVGETMAVTFTCRGTKEGQLQIQVATTSDQTPRALHNDEAVTYIAK